MQSKLGWTTGLDRHDFKEGITRGTRKSLGGEFFLCSRDDLQSAFIAASHSTAAFKIKA
jgi:hypothetical protein